MPSIPKISLADYTYHLPDERIAQHPVTPRDSAKLLCYKGGAISHHRFSALPDLLPSEVMLVFNDTKVIPARLFFQKPTGALIELLLLSPLQPTDMQQAMSTTDETVWKVMVGNKKRWPESLSLSMTLTHTTLEARWHNREQNEVSLRWASTGLPFAAVVQEAGRLPLPPYLKREAEATDYERYQTVYAKAEGAVAAPTAGLHFTPEVMQQLAAKGIAQGFVTLHVGAGTFQPIQETHQGDVAQHPMHNEAIVVSQAQLAALLQYPEGLIPVGTTAMRSLESLYWFGVQLLDQQGQGIFHIPQLWAYTRSQQPLPSAQEALKAVQIYMQAQNLTQLQGYTEIMIMPGYQMRLCRGLITNYHQPQTTLILLVAALIGQDWRKVYQTALDNDYRFLSYGDSSLLLPRG